VLLIDAVNAIAHDRTVSYLRPEHQQRIESAYRAFVDEEGFAKVATTEEIAEQNFSLSIPLYVKRAATLVKNGAESAPSLSEAWNMWEQSARPFWTQMEEVVDLLDGFVGDDSERSEATNG